MPTTSMPIPDLLLHWLRRTQLAGLDIVTVATHQLPIIGSQDFIDVSALASTQFTQRPTNLTQTLTRLLSVPKDDSENSNNTKPIDTGEHKATQTRLTTLWQNQLTQISVQQPIKVQRIEDLVLISCLVTSQEEKVPILAA